jgi:hypothetical protein
MTPWLTSPFALLTQLGSAFRPNMGAHLITWETSIRGERARMIRVVVSGVHE